MHFKFGFICLVNLMFAISCTRSAAAFCSLERMKKFAIEACEHLFLQDETRDRRSIDNGHNSFNNNGFVAVNKKHSIARDVYPHGGYLKVNGERFHKLSRVDVVPKYKPKKYHLDKHERFKRAHFQRFDDARYDSISYCCFNKCEEDFFC